MYLSLQSSGQLLSSDSPADAPPVWIFYLSAIPVALCLAILGIPDIGHRIGAAFRIFYLVAFVFWVVPLAFIQHFFWRRRWPWTTLIASLLLVTYCMSVVNNVAGQFLAVHLGTMPAFRWERLFAELDGCWLPLLSTCALHAVFTFYYDLKGEKLRRVEALNLMREAELRALHYQLHPHFLFNTLNSISSLVVAEQNQAANRMITQLAEFLRVTLSSGDQHEHALADELALTEGYLDIEKARLGTRLVVQRHIGPNVLGAQVPLLLLQPLVENAIRHGIALRSVPGSIDLRVECVGDRLSIRLSNDGPAELFDKEQVDFHSYRLGLKNVSERLEKLYGNAHTFKSGNSGAGCFEVEISLPLRVALPAPAKQ